MSSVDTLRLTLHNYMMSSSHSLRIWQASQIKKVRAEKKRRSGRKELSAMDELLSLEDDVSPIENGLLWMGSGSERVTGYMASVVIENVSIRIHTIKSRADHVAGRGLCSVTFSLPKIKYGVNDREVEPEDIELILQHVGRILTDAGIYTDLEKATISRLDVFADIHTAQPTRDYGEMTGLLVPRRMPDHRLYPPGFFARNTQHQWIVYDKPAEMARRGYYESGRDSFVLRFEYRVLTPSKLRSLGQKYGWVGPYTAVGLRDNWAVVQKLFVDAARSALFDYVHERPFLAAMEEADRQSLSGQKSETFIIRTCAKEYPYKSKALFDLMGRISIVRGYKVDDLLDDLLASKVEVGREASPRSRLVTAFRNAKLKSLFLQKPRLGKLYLELREKVTGDGKEQDDNFLEFSDFDPL